MTQIIAPSPSDVPRLSAFLREAWKEAGLGALGWAGASDASIEEIAAADFLAALVAEPGTVVLAAEDAGEVIGVAVTRTVGEAVAELAGIILLESRTGEGVGRRLLAEAVERARADGASAIVVRTEAANERALRFYARAGFVPEARGIEDVRGTRVDLVTLRRRLDGPAATKAPAERGRASRATSSRRRL